MTRARPADQALLASLPKPASGLRPTGFDPSRDVRFACLCGCMVSDGDTPCDIPECRLRDEAGHFINCGECGQAIDCRDLGEVFRHEVPGHEARKPS